jgi:hypothetical protein
MGSAFLTMILASVWSVAIQILRGPVNHILGLQIHVTEFLQPAKTNGKKYRNEITNVLEGK